MIFEQYIKGEDKEPIRIELRPETIQQAITPQRRQTFLAKIGREGEPVAVTSQFNAGQAENDNAVIKQKLEIE